ncbi:transmembrane protein 26-like [Hydractinia symbiolongicarpus]|uniref:transmembrane protein 26-like n=1 Tax=Hydractinia symbiolongicarpus TaxID=13093 RepID=UPI0025503BB0|nr:transmembrane protein 26-like [Hydractinia symbiolongicarpus]
MKVGQLLKSLFSRLIFFIHGMISVYLLYSNTRKVEYWAIATPLVFLLVEIAYTIGYRRGMEYRYFWPSGFLYIMTMIPIIWFMEFDLLEERINEEKGEDKPTAYLNAFKLDNEEIGKKICELGLIIVLITGRWLMPRGNITRDQLSALLLGYVGNAADIIELFETFEEPGIIYERSVTSAVIAVYTWSIFQFTLVTTATIKDKKMLEDDLEKKLSPKKNRIAPSQKLYGREEKKEIDIKTKYIEEIRTRKSSNEIKGGRGRGRKGYSNMKESKIINASSSQQLDEKVRRRALHGEVFQILVTLLMQDGPFLILRLYLIIQYNVTSEMHIFFTCKNAIVSILLVYRLCILTCRGEDVETNWYKEEAAAKLHNVQLAIMAVHMEEEQVNKIRVQ